MMRLSLVVAALTLFSLAACDSTPKPAPAPVQANQAGQSQSESQAQSADQQAQQSRPKRKYMNTGSRLPSESEDPSVGGGPAGGLTNNTSNVPF